MWDGSEAPTAATSPLPSGGNKRARSDGTGGTDGAGSSGPQAAGEGKAGEPVLSGNQQRRSSTARVEGKFTRQRRPSSFHVVPGVARGSLELSVTTAASAAAAAAAAATAAAAAGSEPGATGTLVTPADRKPQEETGATSSRWLEGQDGVVEKGRKENGHGSGSTAAAGNLPENEELSGNNGGRRGGGGGDEGRESTAGVTPQEGASAGKGGDEFRSSSSDGSSKEAAAAASDGRTSEGNSSDTGTRAEATDGDGDGATASPYRAPVVEGWVRMYVNYY